MPTSRHITIDTPFGEFMLAENALGALRSIWIGVGAAIPDSREDCSLRPDVVAAVRRYFDDRDLEALAWIDTPPGPPFFRACWAACRRIPAGSTWSYRELASAAGNGRAVRAAGQAMRRNPLPLIVPCHRVVASDGALRGFAGSVEVDGAALRLKTRLLSHEHATPGPTSDGGCASLWEERPLLARCSRVHAQEAPGFLVSGNG